MFIIIRSHDLDCKMEDNSPSTSIELVLKSKRRNFEFCIICQKIKDSNQNTKLTSTPEGREKIIQTSNLLNDDTLVDLVESDLDKIQYHVKTCYARYKKTGERYALKKESEKRSIFNNNDKQPNIQSIQEKENN